MPFGGHPQPWQRSLGTEGGGVGADQPDIRRNAAGKAFETHVRARLHQTRAPDKIENAGIGAIPALSHLLGLSGPQRHHLQNLADTLQQRSLDDATEGLKKGVAMPLPPRPRTTAATSDFLRAEVFAPWS